MTNIDELTELLLIHFNLNEQTVFKPSTKTFAGITAGPLFKSLILTSSIKEAAELLEVSDRTIQRVLRSIFDPKSERGGSQRQYLLEFIEHKYCSGCDTIKHLKEFNTSKTRCKECLSDRFKDYYIANKQAIVSRTSIRNTLKLSRIPKWANLETIKQIYSKCPEGYHVDHIVPLQGELVCGLHVENNLQYLTAFDNLSKGNKWEVS